MRTKLEIVSHDNGLIEMRVANRHVCMFESMPMPEVMAKARAYANERPHIGFHITSIKGETDDRCN